MNELELRQIFKNLSDCYADTGRFENDGSYSEGEVIQAMTEDRFVEALREAKLLPMPGVSNRALLRVEPMYDGSGTSVTTYKLVDENGNTLMLADKETCEWYKEHGC